MTNDGGTELTGALRFDHCIGRAFQKILRPRLEAASFEPGPFDVARPLRSAVAPRLSREERFIADVFRSTVEILECTERLRDIEVYVRRFPFRSTRITRERYLRLHIEAHFHECYILRERLDALITRIRRAYRGDPSVDASNAAEGLRQLVEEAMREISQLRGRHVHEWRFDETHLLNLGALEMLAANRDLPGWFLREQRKKVSRHWSVWVRQMNAAIEELLDHYYDRLYPIVFTRPDALRVPARLR